MNIKSILQSLGIVAVSCALGLLVGELATRLVLKPSNYLSVEMVPDKVLGAVPAANTKAGGFDAWGFRNPAVPDRADIVAIGDSHTYGNTATMDDSWPYVLARSSSQRVYNMGLGGYGPNQYFHLLTTRALSLKPKTVVVGLYMGDDFENAFLITYGLDHWASLRELPPQKVNFDIWEAPPAPTWHKKLRVWLSRHSVVYQLIFHGPLLGRFQGQMQIRNAGAANSGATSLSIPEKNILEAFLPHGILRRLDQSSESVREGMRITFKLLQQMNEITQKNGAQLVVAVIPSKEMVFSGELERNKGMPLGDVIEKLLVNERLARERTFEFLGKAGIKTVDTLPALQANISKELYARTAADMHPGRNGYRVIGEAIAQSLRKQVAH